MAELAPSGLPSSYYGSQGVGSFAAPSRNGYTFGGWYANANCTGTKVMGIPSTATGEKEYWAKWNPVTYTITYQLDGGTASGNPTKYTIESEAITLKNPTKTGYTFAGWSGDGLTGSEMKTSPSRRGVQETVPILHIGLPPMGSPCMETAEAARI